MNSDRNAVGVDRGAERARWVEAYRASGLGLKRFAAKHRLRTGQLHYWVYDGRKPRVTKAAAAVFREVVLPGASGTQTTWSAEVGLADGTTIRLGRGADVAWALALVDCLRRPCSP